MKSRLSPIVCFVIVCLFSFLPANAQDVLRPSAPSAAAVESSSDAATLNSFRKSLIKAAEQAQKDGEITRGELFKIRLASLNRSVLRQIHTAASEQVIADGKATAVGAIDWDKLLSFIKEYLPVILEILIKLLA